MTAQTLLDRLAGVKQTGPGRWLAKCPAHEDRRASLSIREIDGGVILINDFAGCAAHEVVASVGLELHNLFPARPLADQVVKGERLPHVSTDVLRAMSTEIVMIVLLGGAVARGEAVSDVDRHRALTAAQRLLAALDAAIPQRDRRAEYRAALRFTGDIAFVKERAA